MERTVLLKKLEICAPALSSADIIAVMSHFWFTGSRVMAYNDAIAISTAFKSEFKGTLPGMTLLNTLRSSKAKDAEFAVDGSELTVKLASTRGKFGYFEPDAFIFAMPKVQGDGPLPVDAADFMRAVECCLRSVSHDTSNPDHLGVTVIPGKKQLSLFATDTATMSAATVPLEKGRAAPFKDRVVLSSEFCRQMLVLSKGVEKFYLEILDDHALLVVGDTVLWGSLIESKDPTDFHANFAHLCSEATLTKLVELPTKLAGIVDRAMIVGESKADRARTNITEDGGRLRFFTKSDHGEMTDTLLVGAEHAGVNVRVEPRLLKNGLGFFNRMLFTSDTVIMSNDHGDLYLIAASEG